MQAEDLNILALKFYKKKIWVYTVQNVGMSGLI